MVVFFSALAHDYFQLFSFEFSPFPFPHLSSHWLHSDRQGGLFHYSIVPGVFVFVLSVQVALIFDLVVVV